MDKRQRISMPVTGGSSLLVIFAVLCLTVFALLGLSTAQAGGRLSQVSADAVLAYYQADTQAEEILARLRSGERPDNVTEEEDIFSYTCPISETQELQVAVQQSETGWTVLRWQAVSTVQWESDDTLQLWDGAPVA